MKKRFQTLWYVWLTALILGASCLLVRASVRKEVWSVTMLDIGQGDSFLLQAANGLRMLIDGGPNDRVLSELAAQLPPGDRRIDVVLATHPDADHIGGLPLVFDRYSVGLFLTTQATSDSAIFKSLMSAVVAHHIPAYFARRNMTLRFDQNMAFNILFPDRDTSGWETNTASIVGRLQIGKTSALFTGDSPVSVEEFLAQAVPSDIDVDVLKLGHHGSKTSSSEIFLKATSPTIALLSAGVNNRYGHPSKEIIDRLIKLSIPFVSTQDVGSYVLRSDGKQWSVE